MKNALYLALIGVFGIGLFGLFSKLLSVEINKANNSSNSSKNSSETVAKSNSSTIISPEIANQSKTSTDNLAQPQIANNSPKTESITQSPKVNASKMLPKIDTTTVAPTTNTPATVSTPVVAATKYKDGVYNSTIKYQVPKATETITVNITIKNDIIANVSNSHSGVKQDSQLYQSDFESALSVNNKKIDTVSLSAVGGASLTTDAFMQALATIQNQAKN